MELFRKIPEGFFKAAYKTCYPSEYFVELLCCP